MKRIGYTLLLIIFTLFIAGAILWVTMNWQMLLLQSQLWQRTFHQQFTQFLIHVKSDPFGTGLLLVGVSFLYGVLHAAGPGHGKIIISTYLATQPTKFKRSLLLTLFSALMQGIVAIVMVSCLLILLKLSSRQLRYGEYMLELVSYILIIFLGLFLCYRNAKKWYRAIKQAYAKPYIYKSFRPMNAHSFSHTHQTAHLECECCGHRHLPNADELAKPSHWYSDLMIIISIGMRPCSGALVMLVFAYSIGVYGWGMIATMSMSIGTAITTSLFALLVYCARQIAEKLLQKQASLSHHGLKIIFGFLAIMGGLLFVVMGLLLALGLPTPTVTTNPIFG